ncbi:MAG: hypothetical protein HY735_00385 [Verrucomicrobia bacterium]|nr:hypothetical protein [Verrucomicrobiota bacterium]
MKARPAWVRRLITMVVLVAVVAVAILAYGYFRLTAEVDVGPVKEPNALDAKEADRKIEIYKNALAGAERGFIRLSEVEINSFLQRHDFGDAKTNAASAAMSSVRLVDCRLQLKPEHLIWYCWVRKGLFGWPVQVVWRRIVQFGRGKDGWVLETKSMSVGSFDVPTRLWPVVHGELGEIDRLFLDRLRWLSSLPMIELRTNHTSPALELRLYTYPVSKPETMRKP